MHNDGILSDPIDLEPKARPPARRVAASPGLVVYDRHTRTQLTVVGLQGIELTVRDVTGEESVIRNDRSRFRIDGGEVELVPVAAARPATAERTASGSIAVATGPRVARASRILVEGRHDAELLELVWGDDLRVEGIVVEILGGMDDLADVVADFAPAPSRRLGILLDHLVDGTKEQRIAATIRDPNVLITGHPYVDVWQAVKPTVAGIDAWPTIPKSEDWKTGICRALGHDDPARFWLELRGRVRQFTDLEPALVGAVERLIDFVATD